MTARSVVGAEMKVLGEATLTVASATPVYFDFGDPADLKLPNLDFIATDRIVVVLTASSQELQGDADPDPGTTDTLTWIVLDAPDNAGAIGATADALVDAELEGAIGANYAVVGVGLKSDRQWLKIGAKTDGTTDTFTCHAVVLAVPAGL